MHDADLTIIDPDRELTVAPEVLQSAQDFTPFAGMKVRGWPAQTILRPVAMHTGSRWWRGRDHLVRLFAPRAFPLDD
jgi:dihydropyrimidinase